MCLCGNECRFCMFVVFCYRSARILCNVHYLIYSYKFIFIFVNQGLYLISSKLLGVIGLVVSYDVLSQDNKHVVLHCIMTNICAIYICKELLITPILTYQRPWFLLIIIVSLVSLRAPKIRQSSVTSVRSDNAWLKRIYC